jgi:hypothetical protein
MPIVHGAVAAAVRVRQDRRLVTWQPPVLGARLYAPRAYVHPADWQRASRGAFALVDTTVPDEQGRLPIAHPQELLVRAVHGVQRHREEAETEIAERWCATESRPLYVDGGLGNSEPLASSEIAIGVVKGHRSLYVAAPSVRVVLELPLHARTSVFLRVAERGPSVASWYLRLRDSRRQDPLFGLVRVEVAVPSASGEREIGQRADLVSRWILAELSPLSLPDPRWHTMAYGVRDVEQFLHALSA